MAEPDTKSGGFLDSVGALATLARAVVQNRTELFSVELQQEKYSFFELLVLGGCMFLFGAVALILASGVVIFLFPEAYRLWVAAGLALAYCAGIFILWRRMQRLLRRAPFDETISQLKKDMECLKSE